MKVPFLDLSLQHAALRSEILTAIAATYDATRFCLGSDVEEFERNFAAELGYPGALALNSGTSPLHLACMLAGLGPGDEVISSPFTFISTVWGVCYVGARPVFSDIDPATYNLDPEKLAAAITARTKAIIVVHLFGQPAPMKEIMALARRHRLLVIEDCAQAVGARYGEGGSQSETPVGLIGDCGTFSFYPTKNLGACGEAGAFVSSRPDWMTGARHIRVHGSDRRYYHDRVGANFRMDGFQGAALNVKLPYLAAWTARRRAIARRYLGELVLADLRLPAQPTYGASVFHQFTVTHPRRDVLRAFLQDQGIGTDLIYPVPLHRQQCFADLGYDEGSLPVAEATARTCVSLPIFPELTDQQVSHVIASVNAFPGMIDGVQLKVCGITSLVDADLADRCGADYLGIIFYPASPRYVSPGQYAAMAERLPPRRRVAVFVEPSAEQLAAAAAAGFDRFQIHFRIEAGASGAQAWSDAVGVDRLWLAPKLPPGTPLPDALLPLAKTFLLDGYRADRFGGTGVTTDWANFARLRREQPGHRWVLSGGLNSANIGAALSETGATFVDVNSGVESAPGVKDLEKLKAFVVGIHKARTPAAPG